MDTNISAIPFHYIIVTTILSQIIRMLYNNTMFQDVTKYVKDSLQCHIAKGDYTEPNTIWGVIIAINPMDLMCIDFTKVDASKDGKEIFLVLTDAFTKFSKAFLTPNQKVITITKILVGKIVLCVWYFCTYTQQ